ncbi:Mgp12p Ecym_3172 [Eremothecium cymbalariae DBVPG|uniref:Glutaredoxin-like protein n=1 Tax=Eremothecium cymbalariae (strain CBS 270.75 / DBVPG 7215 / KCTC 17166 / NRRL Y-17582) TaxID=931890 RepID=G8JRA4_ERECY|nr:Hypothetical protein Ecym_3172 [Eremothecium cymbalariae DBVPG\
MRIINIHRSLHYSRVLRKYRDIKLILFSKEECGLCDSAKQVMTQVLKLPEFKSTQFEITDITDPRNTEWWNKYCFDVPVLHIQDKNNPEKLEKIFHRFNEKQVVQVVKTFK